MFSFHHRAMSSRDAEVHTQKQASESGHGSTVHGPSTSSSIPGALAAPDGDREVDSSSGRHALGGHWTVLSLLKVTRYPPSLRETGSPTCTKMPQSEIDKRQVEYEKKKAAKKRKVAWDVGSSRLRRSIRAA